ncbi:MAG: class I SAM-dependent methyltransferase [Pseudomonadota bacterium]
MSRLAFAIETGAISLPETGTIAVVGPPAGYDLSAFPKDRSVIVTTFKPDHDAFAALGLTVDVTAPPKPSASVIVAGRSKALTFTRIALAASAGHPIIVDGGKDAGIDSIYKAVRKLAPVTPAVAKAHGKVFAVEPTRDLLELAVEPAVVDGFKTFPGVFSADGVDKASALLASILPPLKGVVADFGAGWGYLSAQALKASPDVSAVHLVEADLNALSCARENIIDPRAQFHWADVATWEPEGRIDTIIMNPPFHTSRAADPALGRAFIDAAARALAPKGGLWLVANRQLPYEATLKERFKTGEELTGSAGFKIFHATHPRR